MRYSSWRLKGLKWKKNYYTRTRFSRGGGESKNWREIRVKNEIFSMKIEGFEVVIKKSYTRFSRRGGDSKIDAKIASSRRYSLWRLKALKCYKKILHAIIALGGGFKTPSTFMENISLMTRFSRQFSNSPTHPPLTRKSRVRFFITTSKPSIFMENISLVTLFSRQFFLDWSENLVHRGVDIPSRSHCTHFMRPTAK